MDNIHKHLVVLLDKALELSSQFTGGYSGEFFSAEEFHAALAKSIKRFRLGDKAELTNLCYWFAPTSCWDDFIGKEGEDLANEIDALLSEISMK